MHPTKGWTQCTLIPTVFEVEVLTAPRSSEFPSVESRGTSILRSFPTRAQGIVEDATTQGTQKAALQYKEEEGWFCDRVNCRHLLASPSNVCPVLSIKPHMRTASSGQCIQSRVLCSKKAWTMDSYGP